MNSLTVILAAGALAVAAAVGTHVVLKPAAASPARDAASSEALAGLTQAIEDLERQLAERDQRLDAMRQQLDLMSGPSRTPSWSQADLDAAVARYLKENEGLLAGLLAASAEVPATASDPDLMTAASAVDALMNEALSWEERENLWKKIRDAGLLDQVIAEMEDRAAANPTDATLQYALGNAYLQPIFVGESGPSAGIWATKADKAFDAALSLNPQYWDARFSKAVSLSFWPPALGKQGEAIQQFETLLSQQAGSNLRPEYQQTYLFLGNLYQQTGRNDRAIETWNQGLIAFPDAEDLRRQVELASGQD